MISATFITSLMAQLTLVRSCEYNFLRFSKLLELCLYMFTFEVKNIIIALPPSIRSYDHSIQAFLPYDRQWIKQKLFQHLKKLAQRQHDCCLVRCLLTNKQACVVIGVQSVILGGVSCNIMKCYIADLLSCILDVGLGFIDGLLSSSLVACLWLWYLQVFHRINLCGVLGVGNQRTILSIDGVFLLFFFREVCPPVRKKKQFRIRFCSNINNLIIQFLCV